MRANGMQACSACAGDYEDPERTAGSDGIDEFDEFSEEWEGEAGGGADKFRDPSREQESPQGTSGETL